MKAQKKSQLPPLTDRQLEVLLFIAERIEADPIGRSPTLKQIGVRLGFSRMGAYYHVDRLKDHGCIEGATHLPGGLSLTDIGEEVVSESRNHAASNGTTR